MTTQLHWAPIEQAATATPSPPVVVSPAPAPPRPAPAVAATPAAAAQPNPLDSLKAIAVQIESYLKSVGRTLDFSVDQQSGRFVVTVRDTSGEVVRQIPDEEALRLARTLGTSSGALIDLIA